MIPVIIARPKLKLTKNQEGTANQLTKEAPIRLELVNNK